MKNFAKAMSFMVKQSKLNVKCSEISYEHSKSLFQKVVKLKERKTKIEFDAFVVDCCFEDQKGFIVSFDKKISKRLSHKSSAQAEFDPKNRVELDLRNIFSGKYFDLVG